MVQGFHHPCQAVVYLLACVALFFYADANSYIYEDSSKNKAYGVNPPNATSPSTFQDGTLVLSGTLSDITRLDNNFGFPEPTILATCTFTGGGICFGVMRPLIS